MHWSPQPTDLPWPPAAPTPPRSSWPHGPAPLRRRCRRHRRRSRSWQARRGPTWRSNLLARQVAVPTAPTAAAPVAAPPSTPPLPPPVSLPLTATLPAGPAPSSLAPASLSGQCVGAPRLRTPKRRRGGLCQIAPPPKALGCRRAMASLPLPSKPSPPPLPPPSARAAAAELPPLPPLSPPAAMGGGHPHLLATTVVARRSWQWRRQRQRRRLRRPEGLPRHCPRCCRAIRR
mmetsp:Transcript_68018/g.221429  ORF Transcript_68018/g.221429 Transcript_68018/m.221429 type:complete len:232 (-) Transcript_68018:910-1605(-)